MNDLNNINLTGFEKLALVRLNEQANLIEEQKKIVEKQSKMLAEMMDDSFKQSIPVDHTFAMSVADILKCLENCGSLVMSDRARNRMKQMRSNPDAPFAFLDDEIKNSGKVDRFDVSDVAIAIACFLNQTN